LASTAFKDSTKQPIPTTVTFQFLGGKQKLGKKQSWVKKQVKKSDFWRFTPKPLPIPDFGVHHWK